MYIWLLAFLWLGLDQLTKYLLPRFLNWYESVEIIPGILRLTLVKNIGAAFGFLPGRFWLFVPVALAFIIFIIVKRETIKEIPLAKWGAPLAGAGALGNVIDRLLYGYVIDFIDVPFFSIFNVADIGIVVGIILLALGFYFSERKQEDGFNRA